MGNLLLLQKNLLCDVSSLILLVSSIASCLQSCTLLALSFFYSSIFFHVMTSFLQTTSIFLQLSFPTLFLSVFFTQPYKHSCRIYECLHHSPPHPASGLSRVAPVHQGLPSSSAPVPTRRAACRQSLGVHSLLIIMSRCVAAMYLRTPPSFLHIPTKFLQPPLFCNPPPLFSKPLPLFSEPPAAWGCMQSVWGQHGEGVQLHVGCMGAECSSAGMCGVQLCVGTVGPLWGCVGATASPCRGPQPQLSQLMASTAQLEPQRGAITNKKAKKQMQVEGSD